MHIEVVFALPERQALIELDVAAGATVAEALASSPLRDLFPEYDFAALETGIWGRPVDRAQRLEDGDRVEIYRPLAIDPQRERRTLAAQGRAMGRAAGAPHRNKKELSKNGIR